MIRTVASKVMWVGRATVFLVGLAVILALVMGVASAAFGANNGNFILGKTNVATLITRLAGSNGVDGAMFEVQNNNSGTNDTALSLKVQAGEAPMMVNDTAGKATNLNADKLDGADSAAYQKRVSGECPAGESIRVIAADGSTTCEPDDEVLGAVVRRDGTLARGKGALSATQFGVDSGTYGVRFDRDVTSCVYTATIGLSAVQDSPTGTSPPGEITVAPLSEASGAPNGVFVSTHNSTGTTESRAFHLALNCPGR